MRNLLKAAMLVPFGVLILSICWSFGTHTIAKHAPSWAWTHGNSEMQKIAMKELIMEIKTGKEIKDVVNLLGPGSRDWPSKYTHVGREDDNHGMIAFGVRSESNIGIIVTYSDGKVIKVEIYD